MSGKNSCFILHLQFVRVINPLRTKRTRRTNYSNLICYKTLHVSGIFSAHHQKFTTVNSAVVSFMQVWWSLLSRVRMELHKMYQCRCRAKNWWWAERLPETCRVVIPINLEFCASVGFIHKECNGIFFHTCFFFYFVYTVTCYRKKRCNPNK